MDDDVLVEIKKAEKKTEEIREKAALDKEELISEAKRAAIKIAGDAEGIAKKKADRMISDAEKKLKAEKDKIISDSKDEHNASRKKAEKNVHDASDYVFEKFVEKFE